MFVCCRCVHACSVNTVGGKTNPQTNNNFRKGKFSYVGRHVESMELPAGRIEECESPTFETDTS